MVKFAKYTGKVKTNRYGQGRAVSEETLQLREALIQSARTGEIMVIPGTTENDKKYWTGKIHGQTAALKLRANIYLSDKGEVAFLAKTKTSVSEIPQVAFEAPAKPAAKAAPAKKAAPTKKAATRKR